jgi:hypothetical protein
MLTAPSWIFSLVPPPHKWSLLLPPTDKGILQLSILPIGFGCTGRLTITGDAVRF